MSTADPTLNDIIIKFELQVGDTTELSSQEETDLANDKYHDICNQRPWEFLKKNVSGALTLDPVTKLYYIAIPADFSLFVENNEYTDNTLPINNNAAPKVIFVGANYKPFQIVNYSDRLKYRTQSGVCYADMNANKIYFPVAPDDTSFYTFDYIMVPPDMALLADKPLIPARFRKMIWFAMAVDDEILQRNTSANSQAVNNQAKYQSTLDDMNWWNDNLNLN